MGKSIIQTLSRQLIVIAIGLGTVVFFARVLGPEGRGQYAIALLFSTSLSRFLNLGIAPANVFFLGQKRVSLNIALATSIQWWWKLCVIGITAGALIIWFKAYSWFPNIPQNLLFFSLIIFPASLIQSYLISLFQGIQDFYNYNKLLLISPITTFLAAIFLVKIVNLGVIGALFSSAIGTILGLISCIFLLRKNFNKSNFNNDKNYKSICISYAWKAHINNILTFLNFKIDIFIVNLFLTPKDVGIYIVAVNLVERLWILSSAVSTVTLPQLAALKNNEKERKSLTPIIARLVLFTTLVGALFLIAIAKPLVYTLFGPQFSEANNAIFYLIPGIVIFSLSRSLTNDIAARGFPELNLYVSIVIIVINIILNTILIPIMGISGAALSTSISYISTCIINLILYSNLSKNLWWEPIIIHKSDLRLFLGLKDKHIKK